MRAKKFLALILTLAMSLGLCAPALAAEEGTVTLSLSEDSVTSFTKSASEQKVTLKFIPNPDSLILEGWSGVITVPKDWSVSSKKADTFIAFNNTKENEDDTTSLGVEEQTDAATEKTRSYGFSGSGASKYKVKYLQVVVVAPANASGKNEVKLSELDIGYNAKNQMKETSLTTTVTFVSENTGDTEIEVDDTVKDPEPEKAVVDNTGATIEQSLETGTYKVDDSAKTLSIDTDSTESKEAFEKVVDELVPETKIEDVVKNNLISGLKLSDDDSGTLLYTKPGESDPKPVTKIEFTTKVAPTIKINGLTSNGSGSTKTASFSVEIGLVATKTADITLEGEASPVTGVKVGQPQTLNTSGMTTKMTFTIVLPSYFANKQTFGIHNDTEEVYNGTPTDQVPISFQSTLSPFVFTDQVGATLTHDGTTKNYGTAEGALVYAVNGDTVEIKVAANNKVTVPSTKTGVILKNSTGATLTLVGSGINLTQTSLASGASYTVAARKSSGTVTPTTNNNSGTRYVSGGGGTGTAGVRTDIEIKPGATPTTPTTTVSNVGNFTDVKSNDWFAAPVLWAVNKGITNGVGDNRFDPNGSCTRGQMVTFLWRAAGSPDAAANGRFKDVDANAYYAKAVAWAVANGITDGKGATDTFAPNDQVTRAEAVTFLSRALKGSGSGSSNFNDVPGNSWFAASVGWAVSNGITNGMGDNQFQPNGLCTRAQTVTFLYRAYGNK